MSQSDLNILNGEPHLAAPPDNTKGFGRHMPAILFFVYTFVLIVLVVTELYARVLIPQFRWLVVAAIPMSLLLGICSIGMKPLAGHGTTSADLVRRGLVLMVPLIFLFSAVNNTLGTHALKTRQTDPDAVLASMRFNKGAGPALDAQGRTSVLQLRLHADELVGRGRTDGYRREEHRVHDR